MSHPPTRLDSTLTDSLYTCLLLTALPHCRLTPAVPAPLLLSELIAALRPPYAAPPLLTCLPPPPLPPTRTTCRDSAKLPSPCPSHAHCHLVLLIGKGGIPRPHHLLLLFPLLVPLLLLFHFLLPSLSLLLYASSLWLDKALVGYQVVVVATNSIHPSTSTLPTPSYSHCSCRLQLLRRRRRRRRLPRRSVAAWPGWARGAGPG